MTKTYRPKTWYIQLIHIAKSQLRLDDDLYRDNLKEAVKKDSCKDMSLSELVQVLEHFKKLGFKPKAAKKLSPKSSDKKPNEKTMLDKLRQIWIVMHKQEFINDGSEQALETWAINQSKRFNNGEPVAKLEWTSNQMRYKLIEQLKKWHIRLLISSLDTLSVQAKVFYTDLNIEDHSLWVAHGLRVNSAPNTHEVLSDAFTFFSQLISKYKGA